MAENKGAEKAKKKQEAASESETPQERHKREKKVGRWTLETCMKAARRFATRDEWQHGAPSSFKAAVAHGWDVKCTAHMKAAPIKGTVKKAPMVAAKKKPAPAKLPRSA